MQSGDGRIMGNNTQCSRAAQAKESLPKLH